MAAVVFTVDRQCKGTAGSRLIDLLNGAVGSLRDMNTD